MTAVDEGGPVGHLILRYTNAEKTTILLGFVIVDDSKRGMGYGKRMIQMAIRYAFDMLKAEKITLGYLITTSLRIIAIKQRVFKKFRWSRNCSLRHSEKNGIV